MTNKIKWGEYFYLALYYGFARFLPPTNKNIMGKLGGKLRNCCGRHLFKSCGSPINIEHMAFFGNGRGIELGDNSCMGIHCHYPNNIKIGNHVMFGPHCYIIDNVTHNYDRYDIPVGQQGSSFVNRRTIIGDDVWMGRQCLMIPGKHIGNHVIVGAGSVICKDIPDYVVAAGNPIQVKRDRRGPREKE